MKLLRRLGGDIRHGLRALQKTPAFAIGALVTVALTVGSTTAIYSVVHGVLLRQLPYRDAGRVYWIWSDQPGRDRTPFNVPDFLDYRRATRQLDGLAGFFSYGANLSDESSAERIQGLRATSNFFDVLGARAQVGRLLAGGDAQPGADRVVVLTDGFWRRRFGAEPGIAGRAIRLNGEAFTVIGVLAPGFITPVGGVEMIVPYSPDHDSRRGARNSLNFIIGVGRLGPGVAEWQALADLNGTARRLQEQFPIENARKRGVKLIGALEGVAGSFRTSLLTLFAAVGAVLLIACANLANLMLTRTSARRKELAVQMALGSSRTAVVRQVLVEALLVSIGGGVLGAVLASWGVSGLVALAPAALPRASEIAVNANVLFFSMAVSTLTGVIFGVIPAIVSARVDVRDALQDGSRGATAGGRRLRGVLVSSEVALSVGLLIVMAMLTRSFANVQSVEPGFDAAGVLSARLTLPSRQFNTRDSIVTFQRALTERISSLSGVTHTGTITLLPLSGLLSRVPFTVEGQAIERERVPYAQFRTVSPGYFAAARIPLKRGRLFDDRDTATTRPVAIVSEALAAQWIAGGDPIGSRLLVDDNDAAPRPIEIIGVVGNVKQIALDGGPTWDLYLTYPQVHPDNIAAAASNMSWIVRTASGDPMTLSTAFAAQVRALNPEVAASQIRPMSDYLADAVATRRFSVRLMTIFGAAALVLALVGIYAIVMYSLLQRSREIGIRVALGASPGRIVRLLLAHAAVWVSGGLIAGAALAVGITRAVSNLLFGIAASDPSTYSGVTVAVGAAAAIACLMPMRALFTAGGPLRLPPPS